VDQIDVDIPETLTKEVYVRVISKVLACVRWEAYQKFQEKIVATEGKTKLSPEEADEILDQITF
jgi:hypothetical protein